MAFHSLSVIECEVNPYCCINRYYLEPATPLQSIANTAQLAAPSAKPQSSDIASLTNGTANRANFLR